METKILPVDSVSLKLARDIITEGGAVAFPTETVYGLGANAFSEEAVKNIFAIKGRPNDNPLIVHVHSDYDISTLVSYVPDYAKKLSKKFLPGPLTLVYKSCNKVAKAVSCGLDTLAVRIPSHEGAQRFLRYVDMPIAAPSANISKHVSPVSAEHVYSDLNGRVGLILDGGRCTGGIESTVLDCTGEVPVILRSGLVTRGMIADAVGACEVYKMREGEAARSPGMKYKHYSPDCKTMLFEDATEAVDEYFRQTANGVKTYIMCDGATARGLRVENILNLGDGAEEIAAQLYEKLREGERVAQLIIAVSPRQRDGLMVGVMNRLEKACRGQ